MDVRTKLITSIKSISTIALQARPCSLWALYQIYCFINVIDLTSHKYIANLKLIKLRTVKRCHVSVRASPVTGVGLIIIIGLRAKWLRNLRVNSPLWWESARDRLIPFIKDQWCKIVFNGKKSPWGGKVLPSHEKQLLLSYMLKALH